MDPAQLRAYLESLIGAPYLAWREGDPVFALGPPFFATDSKAPPADLVKTYGTNCAGFLNAARLAAGLAPLGGTPHWQEALLPFWRPFDPAATYPAWTLLLRCYRSEYDQGHLAILWSGDGPALGQKVLHSWMGGGVTLDDTLRESHWWSEEGYYEMVCLPEHWIWV
jgi:hypothetical protein